MLAFGSPGQAAPVARAAGRPARAYRAGTGSFDSSTVRSRRPRTAAPCRRPWPPPPWRFPRTGAACSTPSTQAIGRPREPELRLFRASILTPVAKAELYTAKGSPDGRSRFAPGADRRGPGIAAGRPARPAGDHSRRHHAALDRARTGDREPRLGAGPLPRPSGSGRARRGPAARRPRPLDQGRRRQRRRSATADLRAAAVGSRPAPRPASGSPSFIMCSGSTWTRAASPIPGARARPANGRRRRRGFPAWPRGAGRLRIRVARFPAGRRTRAAARASRRRPLLGRARRTSLRAARVRSKPCSSAAAAERPKASTA